MYKYPYGSLHDHMDKIMDITNYNKFGSNKTIKRKNSRKRKEENNTLKNYINLLY